MFLLCDMFGIYRSWRLDFLEKFVITKIDIINKMMFSIF